MGKALLLQGFGWPVATSRYIMAGGFGGDVTATEARLQASAAVAGTLSDLAVLINATGTSRVYRSRINGSNGNQVVNATDTTAGLYQDSVNTDAVSAGDKFDISSSSTGSPTAYWFRTVFEADSDHACFYATGTVSAPHSTTPTYVPPGGYLNDATEANAAAEIRVAGTARRFQAYVSSNTGAIATTARTRVNGSDGSASLSIGSGATGLFEDTSNTDALADGDTFNYSFVGASGGAGDVTFSFMGCWITNSADDRNDLFCANPGGTSRTASATATYYGISGAPWATTTEANRKVQHGFAGVASKLRINITANTYSGTATLKFRKNGAAGNQAISITAGATGWLEDTTNSDTFVATDDCCLELDEGSSGSLTFRCIGLTEQEQSLTHYTLAADAGVVTLAGQAANTLKGFKVQADAGVVTLAGQAANLNKGYTLAADAGVITLSGQAAGFVWHHRITADAGTVTLAGQDATTKAARRVAADAGIVTILGQNVATLAGYRVAADAGIVAINGQASGLQAARRLVADPGIVALAGQTVGWVRHYRIEAAPGVVTIQGADVGLNRVQFGEGWPVGPRRGFAVGSRGTFPVGSRRSFRVTR